MDKTSRVPDEQKVEVRIAKDDAERKFFYEIEQAEYGADSIVSFEEVLEWWKRYPRGGYRLVRSDEILGGLGLWPLTASTFEALTNGQLDENHMAARHVQPYGEGEPLRYWYFADIILQKPYRQSRDNWAGVLMEGAIRLWLCEPHLAPEVQICALVYSPQGRIIAERLKFEGQAKSPEGYDVYVRISTPAAFYEDVKAYTLRGRNSRRSAPDASVGMSQEEEAENQ